MEERFGQQVGLIKGKGGNFIVRLDGRVVYSKKETGRFPEPGEALALLAPELSG